MAYTTIKLTDDMHVEFSSYSHKYQRRESVRVVSMKGGYDAADLGTIIWCPRAPKEDKKYRCWKGNTGEELGTQGGEPSLKAARQNYVRIAAQMFAEVKAERAKRVQELVAQCREGFRKQGEVGVLWAMDTANLSTKSLFMCSLKEGQDPAYSARFEGLSMGAAMMLVVQDLEAAAAAVAGAA